MTKITPSNLKVSPLERVSLTLLNMFGKRQTFQITLYNKDYRKRRYLFGLIEVEEGQKLELILHGTAPYVERMIQIIQEKGLPVHACLPMPTR
ncbi:MAG: hypothetical protein Kow0037_13250 [Calditrichia bacterium]